ncbi:MAG: hypothetical protein DYG83_09550 [Candidatus Brocadia sp. AMX2]|uniref:Phosphatidylserine decarboxylase n=1 Tax=Candidatus Brocadia sinica JPN1 TaxID=1197129 RepID=A0ABQ0JXW4_9BACT|nr:MULTISPECIES: phosphatidylserine decarboxylase [Brocadia]KXK28857.1 MAG: Phosphatidylserine decarboxylase proenzyme [Candidatus Brocadia sinica]MBC6932610.1 hypothetical protein [Candidatus Brocadia sp.]MBL1169894.1 hypothetical protein [Candidatus Brocadia sp. AMX1]NOG40646.1 hypothetical protein [Planctomycetota bacterium]KAA0244772.1 MAG: hypothetical protein EDM70_05270 [Candidatus Brocadia sp. AMX2]
MNSINKILLLIFCASNCSVLLLSNASGMEDQVEHSPIVKELQKIVESNDDLRLNLEKALKEQEKGSYWHNRKMEDIFDFFDDWLVFLPTTDNPEKYSYLFNEIYRRNQNIRMLLRQPLFIDWLEKFVIGRGNFMDSEKSAGNIKEWVEDSTVNIGEYEVPSGGFKSFNDFFTRKIKSGARPIYMPNDDSIITSPADCTISKIREKLNTETIFEVKDEIFDVKKLLDNSTLANRFLNGDGAICFLMPSDYHRFHSPVNGKIIEVKQSGGLYFAAQDWTNYFFERRRGYFLMETSRYGIVGIVPVGLADISSINFVRKENDIVQKGDELGFFAYGGSAIVLLFEPNRLIDPIYVNNTVYEVSNVKVKMGQKIGSLKDESMK